MENATDHDLAKDYGFDVTVPNGGILSSAASNRLYKTECRKIYSEFLLNMRDYIFQEEQVKQELGKIHDDPAFHDAIVESKSDYASSRMIKMNPRAFSRLVSGKAKIRVLNKDNGYVMHPLSESRTSHLMPKDVDRSSVSERLAVVREKTNYKSPTLSHDLKVNNIVAIKKSLLGDDSTPRLSVGDVMLSARERRSRLFRIQLTNDHIEAKPSDMDIKSPKRNNYFPQRRSKENDEDRDLQMNRWRQRMAFAVGKI
ncbi:uncharacterized protein LOC126810626 [Patella vulgata]|uniref:uncharacterized protein LOC126810626 n=1 Tax=Patella vulgata TaxID=6465 RepID=UPI0024A87720|nr:uncharacterized protein LOC126810626 [Patella vulgata]